MGYYKQLHIDCSPGQCLANQEDDCYQQPVHPNYYQEGDYDPSIDAVDEPLHRDDDE